MRILYFTRDYTPHDLRFLAKLAKTEHQICYLQLERRGHATEDRPLPPEIEIVHWAGGRGPAGWRDGPRLLADLRRVIRLVKPDLIQAGPLQRSAFLVALAGFRPLVSMSWGYDLLIDANRNALWRWATRFTLKHSDALVGDCNTIRQLAISHGMRNERIVTFPWGIDLNHFSDQSAVTSDQYSVASDLPNDVRMSAVNGQRSSVFTVLSTRGWEPIYGTDVIARAFVQAAQQHPELRLVMLGNGSLAGELRKIFTRGRVDDLVSFPGHVGYADLPRYYRMADLYVCASHSDGTSISLLEAMACGRPALISDIPGHREWVTPEENGWLFADGNADALAQGILHAVEQRERLPKMGQAAQLLVEARADWEKNFPKLFEAYKIALKGSG